MAEKTKTRTTRSTRIKHWVNQQDYYIFYSTEQNGFSRSSEPVGLSRFYDILLCTLESTIPVSVNCLTTVNIYFDAGNVTRVVT